mmetsp:Transcript_12232/g.52578  ORF Transcript_12232/g.52578 Transcript_12232/m.52578 type:complete len:211 (-) Transcript_12232:2310-2942(-)
MRCEDPSGATAQILATTTPLCVSTSSPTRLHATTTRGAPMIAVSTVTGDPSKHTDCSSSGCWSLGKSSPSPKVNHLPDATPTGFSGVSVMTLGWLKMSSSSRFTLSARASSAPSGVNDSKKAPSSAAASRRSWECSATQYPSARSGAVVGPPSSGGLCTWTLTPGTSRRFAFGSASRSNVVLPGTKRCSFQKAKTSARKPNAGPDLDRWG